MNDKIRPLADAVRHLVRPGMHLHFAYGGGRPNATVAQLIRQFCGTTPGFTISAHGFVNTQNSLVAEGLVSRLIVAFAGENYPSPRPNRALQRALRSDALTIENWSIGALTARLVAGALGVEFMPVRSLTGSSMATELAGTSYAEVNSFDGREQAVVRALQPDLTLVHGLVADQHGNVLLPAPYGEGAWGSLAAREGVLATVEAVVDDEVLRRHNSLPIVPAHAVRSVSIAPLGSHPYGLYDSGLPGVTGYREDDAFMAEFRDASRNTDDLQEWTRTWILGTKDHNEFVERLGEARVAGLLAVANVAAEPSNKPITTTERMTLVASRVIRHRVLDGGFDVVLSGIGNAHLAAWTAMAPLQEAGTQVALAAELGIFGFSPAAGDPYLFARQNMPTAVSLTDVLTVLGRDVGGPASKSLGVLGAGEIDATGNINSTWSANGDFILGSGGANDVATSADEVVVVIEHSAKRLVTEVPYITAPGRNVQTIVTSEAVLQRRTNRFEVTRYFTDENPQAAAERIRAGIGWDAPIASDFSAEPEPQADELLCLRRFDPYGVFMGK